MCPLMEPAMSHKTIHIPYLLSDACLGHIRGELTKLEGVLSVEFEIQTRNVTIEWTEPATWDDIRDAMSEDGYPPEGSR